MEEQEELISSLRKDYDALQSDMSRLQSDNDAAKDEVKEVLQVFQLGVDCGLIGWMVCGLIGWMVCGLIGWMVCGL